MTAPREQVLQRVRQWATFADEDLRLAEHGMTLLPPCPYRLVAYHAQQCAEKYLKAYLILQNVDFPFTHNISTLRELCETLASWASELASAEVLTSYAVTTRYPGVELDVSETDALAAIESAREVRRTVREALEHAGVGL